VTERVVGTVLMVAGVVFETVRRVRARRFSERNQR